MSQKRQINLMDESRPTTLIARATVAQVTTSKLLILIFEGHLIARLLIKYMPTSKYKLKVLQVPLTWTLKRRKEVTRASVDCPVIEYSRGVQKRDMHSKNVQKGFHVLQPNTEDRFSICMSID